MKAINAVYNVLSNNASLTAVVGTNINPLRIVQGAAYPAITIRVSSVTPHPSKSGHSKTDWANVEVNVYATTYTQCVQIADLTRDAMEVETPQIFNGVYTWEIEYLGESHTSDDNAEEYGVYQIIQDYSISYNRETLGEFFILLENGDFLLLENDGQIII
jgi:hypothetical protein